MREKRGDGGQLPLRLCGRGLELLDGIEKDLETAGKGEVIRVETSEPAPSGGQRAWLD
jgi:hypothetical protein